MPHPLLAKRTWEESDGFNGTNFASQQSNLHSMVCERGRKARRDLVGSARILMHCSISKRAENGLLECVVLLRFRTHKYIHEDFGENWLTCDDYAMSGFAQSKKDLKLESRLCRNLRGRKRYTSIPLLCKEPRKNPRIRLWFPHQMRSPAVHCTFAYKQL